MIKHQRQPSNTSCGQTCVAMLLGIPATTVAAAIKSKSGIGTTHVELGNYLAGRGFAVDRRLSMNRAMPGDSDWLAFDACAIVRLVPRISGSETPKAARQRRKRGHWVLRAEGRWFDPSGGPADDKIPNGWKVASWFGVRRVSFDAGNVLPRAPTAAEVRKARGA